MKIKDLLDKKYVSDTSYQRGDAWTPKTRGLLIDSIFNDFYIPPILIANNEIVDGKQRYTTIKKFENNQIHWTDVKNEKKIFWKNLSNNQKSIFYEKEIRVDDLGKIDKEKLIETFIRINKGSIKLNEIENILAQVTENNRKFINELSKSEEVRLLSNGKKNDKRFTIKKMCLWVITVIIIVHYSENKTFAKSVRQETKKNLKNDIEECIRKKITHNFNKVIKSMYEVCSNDTIPNGSFKVIFTSIFVAFYNYKDSLKNIENNKEEISEEIKKEVVTINGMQMGGGIKYDNIDEILKRIEIVNNILDKYKTDKKRAFTSDEKLALWNKSNKTCEICKNKILNINDCEIDHIIPHCYGGQTVEENARVLCISCNRSEGGKLNKK